VAVFSVQPSHSLVASVKKVPMLMCQKAKPAQASLKKAVGTAVSAVQTMQRKRKPSKKKQAQTTATPKNNLGSGVAVATRNNPPKQHPRTKGVFGVVNRRE
jgi:hypothetical protein